MWGLCALWSSIFPSGMGAREASPAAFTLYLSLMPASVLCCGKNTLASAPVSGRDLELWA